MAPSLEAENIATPASGQKSTYSAIASGSPPACIWNDRSFHMSYFNFLSIGCALMLLGSSWTAREYASGAADK
jgi:hypothetical protein